MIVSFMVGLNVLLGGSSREVQSFPIEISRTPVSVLTEEFSIPGSQELSVWLRVPGRQIESRDITVSVSFQQLDNTPRVELRKEFGFWHTRRSGWRTAPVVGISHVLWSFR